MNVFLSSCELADHATESLTRALKDRGATVAQTPHPQPSNWYAEGLTAAVVRAEAFVSVLTPLWGYSTWMQAEALAGLQAFENGEIRKFCYFNPHDFVITAAGMTPLLLDRLSDEATQAADTIVLALR